MGIINILDAHTSNLIAAGEVVERPSSAAKEMLENSIDAGAKTITLEIKNGGRSLVRVTDDGCGFMREDIPKALLRHATSKISCGDDINGIQTLGFRGEALAAISSVSRLEIVTKHRDEEIGTRLTADENGVVMEDVGCPDGTTISMRDIFYNTPARQKFLKRDGTECASCVAAAERLALSHPEISFTVIVDGERRFTTDGEGKLYPAIYSVFGREFAHTLIPVEYCYNGIDVKGYVCTPDTVRGSRAMQTMFVNSRYVKSKTVQAALEEAFRSYIPRGKYPACVLFVTLDPTLTDVNVHPAKTEIKFASERDVFRTVYYAVKGALSAEPEDAPLTASSKTEDTEQQSVISIKPSSETSSFDTSSSDVRSIAKMLDEKMEVKPVFAEPKAETPPKKTDGFKADIGIEDMFESSPYFVLNDSKASDDETKTDIGSKTDIDAKTTLVAEPEQPQQITLAPEAPVWRMIGQAYDSYIFVQTEDSILIVDKHAAHERIIYERLAKNKELHVQELLAGIPVSVGREQAGILLENSSYLEEKGFRIEDFGDGTVIVRSVPSTLGSVKGLAGILEEFARTLSDGNSLDFSERCDRALYTVACKAALKAGIKNRPEDDENVIKMLADNPHLRYCPHGRPFIKTIAKREIEKYFDR